MFSSTHMLMLKDIIFSCNGSKEHMEVHIEKLDSFADEYKVHGKIGEGSFSEVLKCQDRHSGVCIAAKHLKKSFKSASHAAELPELIALRQLARHPNILHMIESHYETSTGRVTFIFELMDMSLYDMMKTRKRPIPETRAKNYLFQIVKGVAHIHYHGIFHRDIKPENILIKGELLKISDLGSVKGIYTRHPYTEYISTRWYRSPECLLTTGFYGPKMDVWAIGCVFFELLTLKPLFPGSSELDQIAKINAVLGTPNPRLMAKFRKHKCRNISVCFPAKQGSGLNQLIPFISDGGREVMKQMIVYDPDSRTNIRRLTEHKYFLEVRDSYLKLTSMSGATGKDSSKFTLAYRNPALLSYLTTDKRRKVKKKVPTKSHINPATSKITEAKRNAILQQKLQKKQYELLHQEKFRKKQPSARSPTVPERSASLNSNAKVEKNQEQMNFTFNIPSLEKLKARLNAQQNQIPIKGKGAGEGSQIKRLQPMPERKFTLKSGQSKQKGTVANSLKSKLTPSVRPKIFAKSPA